MAFTTKKKMYSLISKCLIFVMPSGGLPFFAAGLNEIMDLHHATTSYKCAADKIAGNARH